MTEDIQDRIKFGPVEYTSDAGRLLDTGLKQTAEILSQQADNPASIRQALTLEWAQTPVHDIYFAKQLLEEGAGNFDKDHQWQGDTPHQLAARIIDYVNHEPVYLSDMAQKEKLIQNALKNFIDLEDKQNIQIVATRDKSARLTNRSGYLFLVVYPPEDQLRQMEISFPTASCHLVGAIGLLDENLIAKILDKKTHPLLSKPKTIKVGKKKYVMRGMKTPPISDSELEAVVSSRGRTAIDKLLQVGFQAIDKTQKREGQHIDPLNAFTDQQYAIQYTLACHRGIGEVKNRKVKLPPLKD